MSKLYSDLHNLYETTKTLKFELRPKKKTKEHFEEFLLKTEEERAKKFKKVKTYCNEVHKAFINECLENVDKNEFSLLLQKYYELFKTNNRTDAQEKDFEKIQTSLRENISKCFSKDKKRYKNLFGEELLKKELPRIYKNDKEKLEEIDVFAKFTTYFKGYNENRKNMYSKEQKSTAIAFRLIDQNLPTFIKNIQNFKKIKETITNIELETNIEDLFSNVEAFVECFTQNGIDTYNKTIGGNPDKKIQGINEIVNLYNQKNPDKKLPKLKILYKQILSDKTNSTFTIDKIEDDKELIDLINEYYKKELKLIIEPKNEDTEEIELVSAIKNLQNFNLSKIWINTDALKIVSKRIFDDFLFINKLIVEEYTSLNPKKEKQSIEKYNEKRGKDLKKKKEYSLSHIENLITKDDLNNKGKLFEYFIDSLLENINNIKTSHKKYNELLSKTHEIGVLNNEVNISHIKDLLEDIKKLQMFIKTFMPKTVGVEIDDVFYNILNYEKLSGIIPVYNKARNYVTQKPYSVEKIPLTFNCPTLLDGWDLNKEDSNLATLFEKDGCYYLGIINKNNNKNNNKKNNKIFKNIQKAKENEPSYKKFEYKLIPGPNKMLPKVFFSASRIEEFKPSSKLLDKYKKGIILD